MPLWSCNFPECSNPGVRTLGDCTLCNRHLCSVHLQAEHHECPQWDSNPDAYDHAEREAEEKEIDALIGKINVQALEARCTQLRRGVPCSIPSLKYDRATKSSVMGGINYHVDIHFEDGISWIARIRRSNATSPPVALGNYISRSEVATLKFLEKTRVPAPRVYDFAPEGAENAVGVGYILMEKLPGRPLQWPLLDSEGRRKITDQLADIYIELAKHPFQKTGSLDGSSEFHVGPLAREEYTTFAKSEMKMIGPFESPRQFHMAKIRMIMDTIVEGETHTQRAVDAYLIHRFLIDLIPRVVPASSLEAFYLKHIDDKGDHILVDDELNITGIIDWEWAHTAPPEIAFNSPMAFLPVGDFYDGKTEIGEDEVVFADMLEEKGHSALAENVRHGRVQHGFEFCCGYNPVDWEGWESLFRGLRDTVGVDAGVAWDEWKRVALERYLDDSGLQTLLAKANKGRSDL